MKNQEFQGLKAQLSYWNNRLAGQWHWHLEKALAPLEVTASQFAVLMAITEGAAKPSDIAAALDVDAAAITRILDRMGEKGLLSRCDSLRKEDRRFVALELSEAGKALVPRLRKAAEDLEGRLLQGLSAAKRRELLETMTVLYQKARSMP
jgi:MarR family multiple antibiotic resistance transcriptional regulator